LGDGGFSNVKAVLLPSENAETLASDVDPQLLIKIMF